MDYKGHTCWSDKRYLSINRYSYRIALNYVPSRRAALSLANCSRIIAVEYLVCLSLRVVNVIFAMDLNELLQQAQRLRNETKMDTEMPRVERTLSQVLQATQELHSRVTQAGTNDLQA